MQINLKNGEVKVKLTAFEKRQLEGAMATLSVLANNKVDGAEDAATGVATVLAKLKTEESD